MIHTQPSKFIHNNNSMHLYLSYSSSIIFYCFLILSLKIKAYLWNKDYNSIYDYMSDEVTKTELQVTKSGYLYKEEPPKNHDKEIPKILFACSNASPGILERAISNLTKIYTRIVRDKNNFFLESQSHNQFYKLLNSISPNEEFKNYYANPNNWISISRSELSGHSDKLKIKDKDKEKNNNNKNNMKSSPKYLSYYNLQKNDIIKMGKIMFKVLEIQTEDNEKSIHHDNNEDNEIDQNTSEQIFNDPGVESLIKDDKAKLEYKSNPKINQILKSEDSTFRNYNNEIMRNNFFNKKTNSRDNARSKSLESNDNNESAESIESDSENNEINSEGSIPELVSNSIIPKTNESELYRIKHTELNQSSKLKIANVNNLININSNSNNINYSNNNFEADKLNSSIADNSKHFFIRNNKDNRDVKYSHKTNLNELNTKRNDTTFNKKKKKKKKIKNDHNESYYEIPSCRICFGITSNVDPLICPCKCIGSVKYIHVECLKHWIATRITTKQYKNLTVLNIKSTDCDLCQQEIPYRIKVKDNIINLINFEKPSAANYIVLEGFFWEKKESKNWYIVHLDRKTEEIKFGRANYSDVRMSCISVSRDHAVLRINDKGQFYLEDLNSKFGTLILLNRHIKLIPETTIAIQYNNLLVYFKVKRKIVLSCCFSKIPKQFEFSDYNKMFQYLKLGKAQEKVTSVMFFSVEDNDKKEKMKSKYDNKNKKKSVFVGKELVINSNYFKPQFLYDEENNIISQANKNNEEINPFHLIKKNSNNMTNTCNLLESRIESRLEDGIDKVIGNNQSNINNKEKIKSENALFRISAISNNENKIISNSNKIIQPIMYNQIMNTEFNAVHSKSGFFEQVSNTNNKNNNNRINKLVKINRQEYSSQNLSSEYDNLKYKNENHYSVKEEICFKKKEIKKSDSSIKASIIIPKLDIESIKEKSKTPSIYHNNSRDNDVFRKKNIKNNRSKSFMLLEPPKKEINFKMSFNKEQDNKNRCLRSISTNTKNIKII